MENKDFESFFTQYLETALWSSNDESDESGGEPLDANYDVRDFTKAAIATARKECKAFFNANYDDMVKASKYAARSKYLKETGIDSDNAEDLADIDFGTHGFDFWLTRNRHGAGFWDRGYGQVGDKLSEAAKSFGESYIYVNRRRLHFA
jgi:hypothetical protein